jgi:hypothetical protein
VVADAPPLPLRSLPATVAALGIAQIVSWGTLFYSIAVLGAPLRAELGLSDVFLFGGFSAGLALSGIVSPAIGRWIDAGRARAVLGAGSVVGAGAFVVLAAAQGPLAVLAGWLLAGLAMALCLYDPAFAALHRISGAKYRRAVTALTLFGGFASTVFWPLSQLLLDAVGWRAAFGIYAALHLLLCLPLHVLAIPGAGAAPPGGAAGATAPQGVSVAAPGPRVAGGAVFRWLAAALAGASFLSAALSAHLIGLLTAGGLTAGDAVLVGALIGPMQVAGRVVEFTLARDLKAQAVGTLAFALLAAALALLTQVRGLWAVALAFALLYGFSNGVMTIVRGTVPAELFGQRDFGALLGRLARPQLVARAVAPVALTLFFPLDPARTITLWALAAGGVFALAAYRRAVRSAPPSG